MILKFNFDFILFFLKGEIQNLEEKTELIEIFCARDVTPMEQNRGGTSWRSIFSHGRYNLQAVLPTQNLAKIIF